MQRHGSADAGKTAATRTQVSAPYFWDFGLYEKIFASNSPAPDKESEEQKQPSSAGAHAQSDEGAASLAAKVQVSPRSAAQSPRIAPLSSSKSPTSGEKKPVWQPVLKEEDLTTYVVAFGETFESIALKHDMTAVELRRLNPGVPFFSRPIPGQELKVKKLPGVSSVTASEESKTDYENPKTRRESIDERDQVRPKAQQDVVERTVSLCIGPIDRIAGRLMIGVSSGFILFEPFEGPTQADQPRMLFALDRRDVMGCAAVSRITARMTNDEDNQSMLLQVVWRNSELGFSAEQQVFFEAPHGDIGALVDAIYASELGLNSGGRQSSKTLTSGVPALRALEEGQKSMVVEDFVILPDIEDEITDVEMMPRDSAFLTKNQAVALAKSLPSRLRNGSWRLVYDFTDNGVSLDALFAAAKHHEETILLIRDMTTREVVGVFAAQAWDYSGRTGTFFGTGETMVFRFRHNDSDIEVFPWAGENEFFQTCSNTYLAVGGGGNFALCVDSDLLNCTSGPCKTFKGLESRPLSSRPNFATDGIELWALHTLKARSSTLGSLEDRIRSPRMQTFKSSQASSGGRELQRSSSSQSVKSMPSFDQQGGGTPNARNDTRSPTNVVEAEGAGKRI